MGCVSGVALMKRQISVDPTVGKIVIGAAQCFNSSVPITGAPVSFAPSNSGGSGPKLGSRNSSVSVSSISSSGTSRTKTEERVGATDWERASAKLAESEAAKLAGTEAPKLDGIEMVLSLSASTTRN